MDRESKRGKKNDRSIRVKAGINDNVGIRLYICLCSVFGVVLGLYLYCHSLSAFCGIPFHVTIHKILIIKLALTYLQC